MVPPPRSRHHKQLSASLENTVPISHRRKPFESTSDRLLEAYNSLQSALITPSDATLKDSIKLRQQQLHSKSENFFTPLILYAPIPQRPASAPIQPSHPHSRSHHNAQYLHHHTQLRSTLQSQLDSEIALQASSLKLQHALAEQIRTEIEKREASRKRETMLRVRLKELGGTEEGVGLGLIRQLAKEREGREREWRRERRDGAGPWIEGWGLGYEHNKGMARAEKMGWKLVGDAVELKKDLRANWGDAVGSGVWWRKDDADGGQTADGDLTVVLETEESRFRSWKFPGLDKGKEQADD